MSRYFVLLADSGPTPYVLAEVVREHSDDGMDRAESLAANLAGERGEIVTEVEMNGRVGGAATLTLWRDGNDDAFDLDTVVQEQLSHLPVALEADPEVMVVADETEMAHRTDELRAELRRRMATIARLLAALDSQPARRGGAPRGGATPLRLVRSR